MFEKFGEFDSAEELNRAAEAQRKEGDKEALLILAKENGIDKEDVEDFYDEIIEEFATPLIAATGKLKVEIKEYGLKAVLKDWAEELIELCIDNPNMAAGIRRKGKGLDGYIALLAEEGYANRAVIDKRIVDKAPNCKKICGNHEFSIGIPDKKTRKQIAIKYYIDPNTNIESKHLEEDKKNESI